MTDSFFFRPKATKPQNRNSHVFNRSWSCTSISSILICWILGFHFFAHCHVTIFSPCFCETPYDSRYDRFEVFFLFGLNLSFPLFFFAPVASFGGFCIWVLQSGVNLREQCIYGRWFCNPCVQKTYKLYIRSPIFGVCLFSISSLEIRSWLWLLTFYLRDICFACSSSRYTLWGCHSWFHIVKQKDIQRIY